MRKPIDIDALVAQAVPPRPNPQLMFSIDVRVDSETNGREHWAKKGNRKKKQKEALLAEWMYLKNKGEVRLKGLPYTVRFTRVGSRRLDDDNLAESFKACRDTLAGLLGVDDGDERIKWEYAQAPVGKRVYQVRVEVY